MLDRVRLQVEDTPTATVVRLEEGMSVSTLSLAYLAPPFHFTASRGWGEGDGAVSLMDNSPEFSRLSTDWPLFFSSFACIHLANQIPPRSI